MTSIISPSDTGEHTQNLIPFLLHPPMRRPEVFRPADLGEVETMSAGATLILPLDAVPAPARLTSTVTYRPSHAHRPVGYLSRHRRASSWPYVALAVGTALLALTGAALGLVATR